MSLLSSPAQSDFIEIETKDELTLGTWLMVKTRGNLMRLSMTTGRCCCPRGELNWGCRQGVPPFLYEACVAMLSSRFLPFISSLFKPCENIQCTCATPLPASQEVEAMCTQVYTHTKACAVTYGCCLTKRKCWGRQDFQDWTRLTPQMHNPLREMSQASKASLSGKKNNSWTECSAAKKLMNLVLPHIQSVQVSEGCEVCSQEDGRASPGPVVLLTLWGWQRQTCLLSTAEVGGRNATCYLWYVWEFACFTNCCVMYFTLFVLCLVACDK